MKKTIFIFLLASLVLVGLVSCKEEVGTATLKLMLKKIDIVPKALKPGNDADLRVARYTIVGTGPDNASFNISTDSPSVTINGLKIGHWDITAKGVNLADIELIRGTASVDLDAGSGTKTILLNQLIGTGTFSLEVNWLDTEVPDPELELYSKRQGEAEQAMAFQEDYANKRATITNMSLAAGSYIVRGVLKSGDFTIGGFVETVRIVVGQDTSGVATISQAEFPDATGYFYLNDQLGEPVKGQFSADSFDGNEEDGFTIPADTDHPVTFVLDEKFQSDPEAASSCHIEWFLDGESVESDDDDPLKTVNHQNFNVGPGSHRIDAVVNNDLLGSYGSVSMSFEAVANVGTGVVVRLNNFTKVRSDKDAKTFITLGARTIASPLPGGKFLIVSPENSKILVVKPERNYIEVLKAFDNSTFSYIADIDKVVSDETVPWVVLQDGRNMAFLKFNEENNDLELFQNFGRVTGPVIYKDTKTMTFGDVKNIGFNADKGCIHITDTSCKVGANDAKCLMVSLTVDEAQKKMELTAKILLSSSMGAGCNMSIAPSGDLVAMVGGNSPQIEVREIGNGGGTGWGSPLATSPNDLVGNARYVKIIEDGIILASGTKLQSFNPTESGYTRTDLNVTSDCVVSYTIGTAGNNFICSLDKAGRTLTAFSRVGATFNSLAACTVSNDPADTLTGMAMSGPYIIATSETGRLFLCRANQ